MARILPTGLAQPWQYKEKKIVQHTPMTQVGPTELKAIYDVGKSLWDEVISPNMAALIGAIVRANQAEGPDKAASVKEVSRLAAVMKAGPKDMAKAKEGAAAVAKQGLKDGERYPGEFANPQSVAHKMGKWDPEITPEDLTAREERRVAREEITFEEQRNPQIVAEENLFIDKLYGKFEDGSYTQERILNYLTSHAENLAAREFDIENIRQKVNSWWDAEALKEPSRSWSGDLEAARQQYPNLDLELDESGEIKVIGQDGLPYITQTPARMDAATASGREQHGQPWEDTRAGPADIRSTTRGDWDIESTDLNTPAMIIHGDRLGVDTSRDIHGAPQFDPITAGSGPVPPGVAPDTPKTLTDYDRRMRDLDLEQLEIDRMAREAAPPPEPLPPTAVPPTPAAVARDPGRYDNIWAEAAAATTPEEQADIVQRYVDTYQPRDMGEVLWGDDYRKEAQAKRIREFMSAASKYKGTSPALEEQRKLKNARLRAENLARSKGYTELTGDEILRLSAIEAKAYEDILSTKRELTKSKKEDLELAADQLTLIKRKLVEVEGKEAELYYAHMEEFRAAQKHGWKEEDRKLEREKTKAQIDKLLRDADREAKDTIDKKRRLVQAALRQRAIRITNELREMLKNPRVYGTGINAKVIEHDKVVKEMARVADMSDDQLQAYLRGL